VSEESNHKAQLRALWQRVKKARAESKVREEGKGGDAKSRPPVSGGVLASPPTSREVPPTDLRSIRPLPLLYLFLLGHPGGFPSLPFSERERP